MFQGAKASGPRSRYTDRHDQAGRQRANAPAPAQGDTTPHAARIIPDDQRDPRRHPQARPEVRDRRQHPREDPLAERARPRPMAATMSTAYDRIPLSNGQFVTVGFLVDTALSAADVAALAGMPVDDF